MILPGLATAVAAALLLFFRANAANPGRAAIAGWFLFVVVLDAVRAYEGSPEWRTTNIAVQGATVFSLPGVDQLFQHLDFRPERLNVGNVEWSSGRGFYSGVFVYEGYDATRRLSRYGRILDIYHKKVIPAPDVGLPRFMQQPSTVLSLPPDASKSEISDAVFAASGNSDGKPLMPPGVTMHSFSDTLLQYEVNLRKPALVVENEMFWKGWSGKLTDPSSGQIIAMLDPIEQLDTIRSWQLPAGHYLFRVEFSDPHLRGVLLLTLAVELPLAVAIAALARTLARRDTMVASSTGNEVRLTCEQSTRGPNADSCRDEF
jgi:hypothetical protein